MSLDTAAGSLNAAATTMSSGVSILLSLIFLSSLPSLSVSPIFLAPIIPYVNYGCLIPLPDLVVCYSFVPFFSELFENKRCGQRYHVLMWRRSGMQAQERMYKLKRVSHINVKDNKPGSSTSTPDRVGSPKLFAEFKSYVRSSARAPLFQLLQMIRCPIQNTLQR